MTSHDILGEAQELFLQGKYEESTGKFTEALDAGAESALAYLSRGVAYLLIDSKEEAIADFGRFIEINPDSVRGYYYRGIALLSRDDYEQALPDLNRVLELDPDHGPAHLARGTLYGLVGEEEKSSLDIKTAIVKSETALQGFADASGILRTQFHKAMAHMAGERAHDPALALTEEEMEQVKKWIGGG
jgi:tetratricopeptide (TPR) repeat protein